MRGSMVNKKRGDKTNGLNVGREVLKPCSRCLFQTIKRFLKKTNVIGKIRILKTERLLTTDSFFERSMKKSIFDV
jgi:uncharacterized protein YcbX